MTPEPLADVGIEAELQLQEIGAYMAPTAQGKYKGMVYGPITVSFEPDGPTYGRYIPDQPRHRSYVNDPQITAILKEQWRTKDLETRQQLLFAFQRYEAEQGRKSGLSYRAPGDSLEPDQVTPEGRLAHPSIHAAATRLLSLLCLLLRNRQATRSQHSAR